MTLFCYNVQVDPVGDSEILKRHKLRILFLEFTWATRETCITISYTDKPLD